MVCTSGVRTHIIVPPSVSLSLSLSRSLYLSLSACMYGTSVLHLYDTCFGRLIYLLVRSLHVRIVELVQDVVSVLLLPIYFAVSGLKTDLTLLDNATSWGICALTIAAACLGTAG